MPESLVHIQLVRAIVQWVSAQTSYSDRAAILIAGPEVSSAAQPPRINGCVPDVYGKSSHENFALIGEAKTATDIDTLRTRNQLTSYLLHLAEFDASVLVVAVPWYSTNQVRSLLRRLQRVTSTQKVQVIVLDQLPG